MIKKWLSCAALLGALAWAPNALAAMDEYGTHGKILGVEFTGGDGSYIRAVEEGLVLGICPDFPWTYQDEETKEYAGVDVSIMKEVARRLGIKKLSYEIMPIAGVIPALMANRIDVIAINLHVNEERLKAVSFTSPAYFYGGVIAVRKGNPKNITTWESLAGKSVGTYRGSVYHFTLQDRKDLGNFGLYATSANGLADLEAGRLDAVLDDDIKILKYIEENPRTNVELTTVAIPNDIQLGYARYALRPKDVDLNWAISRAIDEMRADGTMVKLIAEIGLPPRNLLSYPLN